MGRNYTCIHIIQRVCLFAHSYTMQNTSLNKCPVSKPLCSGVQLTWSLSSVTKCMSVVAGKFPVSEAVKHAILRYLINPYNLEYASVCIT